MGVGTADPPLRAGLRWLAGKRVTLGVLAVLVFVFAVELVVWQTLGPASWAHAFLASTTPSPGWVTAPFAHRSLEHLVTTGVVIAVYGSLLEAGLRPAAYLLFYLTAGYASTVAQLWAYVGGTPGLGTLGASGAALGLVTLFTATAGARVVGDGDGPSRVEVLFAGTGVCIVGLLLANDFLGIQFAPGTAPYGHLGGMVTGGCVGLVRARAQGRSGRQSSGEP